jgi:hypothetical protein
MAEDDDRKSVESIDSENLTVTGKHEGRQSNIEILKGPKDETIIIVTQAFGPKGDNLVGVSDVDFDGYPAVTLKIKADGREGLVHLSPIHGDPRKKGFTNIAPGTHCELFCPVSEEPLPKVGEVEDGSEASYYALWLTPRMDEGAMVMISDVWGHYHSRIIDDMELISYWAATHADGDA